MYGMVTNNKKKQEGRKAQLYLLAYGYISYPL